MHPCPNHDHVHATKPSIGQCIHAQTMITSMQPTHPLASASMPKPFINKCFCAETSFLFFIFCANHHNGNAMLSDADMRKYRPCPAFPTLFEAGVKEHIVQNLALSLHPVLSLHFPIKIKSSGRAETSSCFFFCVLSSYRGRHVPLCQHVKVLALPCFSHLVRRQTGPSDGDGPKK